MLLCYTILVIRSLTRTHTYTRFTFTHQCDSTRVQGSQTFWHILSNSTQVNLFNVSQSRIIVWITWSYRATLNFMCCWKFSSRKKRKSFANDNNESSDAYNEEQFLYIRILPAFVFIVYYSMCIRHRHDCWINKIKNDIRATKKNFAAYSYSLNLESFWNSNELDCPLITSSVHGTQ